MIFIVSSQKNHIMHTPFTEPASLIRVHSGHLPLPARVAAGDIHLQSGGNPI